MRWGLWGVVVAVAMGCGERPLTPREPTPGVMNFRIATFNIWDENATDPATLDAIGQLGAEIIALQEVTREAAPMIRARYQDRYPYMLFYPSGSAGLGFLSQWPIEDRGLTDPGNGWHPAWHVWVRTPHGLLETMVVHLRAPEGKGLASLSSIAALSGDHRAEIKTFSDECAGDLPVVALGDFNEGPDGAAVQYLEDRGFQNALPLYRPGQFTWQARKSVGGQFKSTIDHIMFDPRMLPLDAYTKNIGRSDHLPVVAHLELSSQWTKVE